MVFVLLLLGPRFIPLFRIINWTCCHGQEHPLVRLCCRISSHEITQRLCGWALYFCWGTDWREHQIRRLSSHHSNRSVCASILQLPPLSHYSFYSFLQRLAELPVVTTRFIFLAHAWQLVSFFFCLVAWLSTKSAITVGRCTLFLVLWTNSIQVNLQGDYGKRDSKLVSGQSQIERPIHWGRIEAVNTSITVVSALTFILKGGIFGNIVS